MHIDHNDENLKRYLDDIRRTRPLSRSEEQVLFRLVAQGNRKAKERLVSANMRFVLKVVIQYRSPFIPISDLVNEGAMGLVRAIESFDYSRGLKFISYGVWWIKAYITRAINEQGSLIRLPANQQLRVRKALKSQARGVEIDEDIRELLQIGQRGISFDSPLSGDSKTTYAEILSDDSMMSPDRRTEINSVETVVHSLLEHLPYREGRVIAGIYGVRQDSPQTLREVGESLNISHERVRQLRDQALRRIRRASCRPYLQENFFALTDVNS
ncbi:MAG: sigma-70 family RNA polymerase sigma factor [Fibrobacteraceae bacterium]|jgi:RNA polymerase primary sigma factor|nr:MAG: RNA polymerase subunit sigma-32 [Fibrobacteres bacterium CG2_30_45_31]